MELKVLGSTVMFLPLGNKKYRLRGKESYLALQGKREDGDKAERDDRREGMGRRVQFEVNTHGEG